VPTNEHRTRDRDVRLEIVVLLSGVAFSAGLAIVMYVLGKESGLANIFSLLGGMVGLVITLQSESLVRANRSTREIVGAGRTLSLIHAVPWAGTPLNRALDAAGKVDAKYPGSIVAQLSREYLDGFVARIEDLARGKTEVPYYDDSLIHLLTEHCEQPILATSMQEISANWWSTPGGERSWQLQLDAMKRGVRITRIFIYDRWDTRLDQLAQRQHAEGVDTFRVRRSKLPPELKVDMILWDNLCLFEARANASGDAINREYSFSPSELASARKRFEIIRSAAEAWLVNRAC
jgi:hypothetical protein